MKILLIMPPHEGLRASGENLGLSYIHAAIKAGTTSEVNIFNRLGNKSEKEILVEVERLKPDLIGIGVTSYYLLNSMEQLLQKIKLCNSPTICVGGHYMMFRGRQILENINNVDIVVYGEGEETIVEIVNAIEKRSPLGNIKGILFREHGQIKETEPRYAIENLDLLPIPTRENDLEVYNISASRGCYMSCSFCSVPNFYKSIPGRDFRIRSVESIRGEVSFLKNLGAKAISFIDDVFLLPGKKGINRAQMIADVMDESGVNWAFACRTSELTEEVVKYCKSKGLCNIGLGLESGSEEVLKRFTKRARIQDSIISIQLCRKYDISIIPYFIMFEPDISVNELQMSARFLTEYDLAWPSFVRNRLDPYPGTKVFEDLEKQNRLREHAGRYEATYVSDKIECIFNNIDSPLREAEEVEYSIRRWEFRNDIQEESEHRITSRRHIRAAFRKLSNLTGEFVIKACQGIYDKDKYLNEISNLKKALILEDRAV
jgi:radical SAM superfamily enzyme YgiQ (UPF0313 family)